MHPSIRVLQLGPLYNNHLRRWSERAVSTGCAVYAAGHVAPGRRPVDLSGVADLVEVAPYEMSDEEHVAWLRSLLGRLQPDIVQAHYLFRWPYLATLAGCRPLVATPWGSDLYLATGDARRRVEHALRHADVVIARSPHMRRELLARGVPDSRVEPVDLGVDLESFKPPPEPADRRPPVILSFRAATELYNLDVVLDAFRLVLRRVPDVTLVLVHGDAPLEEPVRARVGALGSSVQMCGHVAHTEMAGYMRAATVGVSVPRSDGSPSSVWEALACGLPLVLSDLPQLEERVGGAGGAVFVEPRAEPVAAALTEVLEQPERRRRMAKDARTWAESHVDQRLQASRLSALYARFAGRDTELRDARPLRSS